MARPPWKSRPAGYPGRAPARAKEGDGEAGQSRFPGRRAEVGRPVLSVSGLSGDQRRRSTPCRCWWCSQCLAAPLRELVGADLGAAGGCRSASPARVLARVLARPEQRHLTSLQVPCSPPSACRAKNAILIVEVRRGGRARAGKTPCRRRKEAPACAFARPDDLLRAFTAGVTPLALSTRRGRGQPERYWHWGDRRHADRHHPGDLHGSAVLRAGARLVQKPTARPSRRRSCASAAGRP